MYIHTVVFFVCSNLRINTYYIQLHVIRLTHWTTTFHYIKPVQTMTKLLEWVSALSAVFAVWYSLVGGYVKHPAIEQNFNFILVSPILFIILFGVYAVTVILYRVVTFNNCEEAAKELQLEIIEARKDLLSKGLEL